MGKKKGKWELDTTALTMTYTLPTGETKDWSLKDAYPSIDLLTLQPVELEGVANGFQQKVNDHRTSDKAKAATAEAKLAIMEEAAQRWIKDREWKMPSTERKHATIAELAEANEAKAKLEAERDAMLKLFTPAQLKAYKKAMSS